MAIWSILRSFGIFSPFRNVVTKKYGNPDHGAVYSEKIGDTKKITDEWQGTKVGQVRG
jgi:hypothetical protein